jgi:hypothetical protein
VPNGRNQPCLDHKKQKYVENGIRNLPGRATFQKPIFFEEPGIIVKLITKMIITPELETLLKWPFPMHGSLNAWLSIRCKRVL